MRSHSFHGGAEYYNLESLLTQYPHLHFEDDVLSFHGVLWYSTCVQDGRSVHVSACYPKYEADCPGRFMPEIVPGRPGCLGSPKAVATSFRTETRGQSAALQPSSSSEVTYTSPSLDDGQIVRYEIPLQPEVRSVIVGALGSGSWEASDLLKQYPYLHFDHDAVYFNGTLASDICTATDEYYETGCFERYREECDGVYMDEIIPGRAGCLSDADDRRKALFARLETGGSSGSFTIPEGARSFQLVLSGYRLTELIDPNGKDYVAEFVDDRDPAPLRLLRGHTVVMTEATSDVDHGYADVLVPGEWTFRVEGSAGRNVPFAILAVKTRNDPDDKIRVRVVNASAHPNEVFAPKFDRMVELAALLGMNVEVSSIEKVPEMAHPYALKDGLCERFCSSDEAVMFIAGVDNWSSPGPGVGFKMEYNTHFNVGAEVGSSDDDHYLASALHELLHYVAGLGHLYRRHNGAIVDVDGLASTGLPEETVLRTAKIAGGVNYKRFWETGQLLWHYNIMLGLPWLHDERDVDGFGYTDANGRRFALITFLEHHQLQWVKDSVFSW